MRWVSGGGTNYIYSRILLIFLFLGVSGFPRKKKKKVCSNIVMPPKCLERVCSVCSVSSLRHEWWLSSRKNITFGQFLGYILLRQTNNKPNKWLPHPTSLHPRRPPIHLLPLARRDVPRRVDCWIPNIGWMTINHIPHVLILALI